MYIHNSSRQLLLLAYAVFRTLKAHSCRSDGVNTAFITSLTISLEEKGLCKSHETWRVAYSKRIELNRLPVWGLCGWLAGWLCLSRYRNVPRLLSVAQSRSISSFMLYVATRDNGRTANRTRETFMTEFYYQNGVIYVCDC